MTVIKQIFTITMSWEAYDIIVCYDMNIKDKSSKSLLNPLTRIKLKNSKTLIPHVI